MRKFIVLAITLFGGVAAASDECPSDREARCVDEFKEALPFCKKAAETKGSDKDADLNCIKYAYQMDKDCWPCICSVAQKEGVKIYGCS